MKSIYIKTETIMLLIVEILIFILGIWAFSQDITFFLTKKEASAEVIKLEKLPLPKPYKITLKYFNDFENKYIITYIDDIDGRYGQSLNSKKQLNIFYKKSSPHIIYLVDYKYPNLGNLILYILFLLIMIIAIFFQALRLKTP